MSDPRRKIARHGSRNDGTQEKRELDDSDSPR